MLVKLMLTLIYALSHGIRALGLKSLAALGSGLGAFLFFIHFRKRVVMDNLKLAYGKELSAEELEKLARQVYRSIGTTFLEIARNFSLTKEQMQIEMDFEPEDKKKLKALQERGIGAIYISCHMANWELFGMGVACHDFPTTIVVRKISGAISQALIEQRRELTGIHIIYPGGALAKMKEAVSQGRMVGYMIDQHTPAPKGIRVNFFGTPASSSRGLAKIARETHCLIFPICAFRQADGKHRIKLLEALPYITAPEFPENSPEREAREEYLNIQQYQAAMEKLIRMHPEQWLWIHRRWKVDRTPLEPSTAYKANIL